jgi:molecular chaperone HscB
MLQCPSCSRLQEPRLICSHCGSPLPAVELDLFAAVGLPRQLQIGISSLESTYHELGRRIHPDRFASSSSEVRDASLKATALLTRAHRTLRDPVSRGLYWLELHGHKLSENNNQVPPDLAELVFEVQEQLGNLREALEQNKLAARDQAVELTVTQARLQGLIDELYAELVENFAAFDGGEGDPDERFAQLKAVLSKIAYLRTLMRDVTGELERTSRETSS